MLDISPISIPTPEPYDDQNPERQRENLAFVALQIIQLLHAQQPVLSVGDDLVQAVRDLQFSTAHIKIGELVDIHISRKTLTTSV